MFSFFYLLWFLTSNFISFWSYWNFFNLSNANKDTIKVYSNIIQEDNSNYVVESMAKDIWKSHKDISSLWIIANCSGNINKTDIENDIDSNSWTILSWFDNWDTKVSIDNCNYYNIKNPSFNKDLTDTVLNNFSWSKLKDNWDFTWTDVSDITTRWFDLKSNSIETEITWWVNKLLIVSSEKYLYWSDKNKIKLVYHIPNLKFSDLSNTTGNFNYVWKFTKYIWLNDDWTFDKINQKPVLYKNKTNVWNNYNQLETGYIYQANYNNPINKSINYEVITNYTWDNSWTYFLNDTKYNTTDNNQNNDFNNIFYIISDNNINVESKEWTKTADLNLKALWNYVKNKWNVDNIYFYNDIVNWKTYMSATQNNNNYFFSITWDNWSYNINYCLNKNNDITDKTNYKIKLSVWIDNWSNTWSINYNEGTFNDVCYKTYQVWSFTTKKIDIDKNNEQKLKEIQNIQFYSDKKNSLDNYIKYNDDYLAKNYIITTPWEYSNILINLDKHLNKKPYVVYLYKSNNSITDISYDPKKEISNYTLDWDSSYDNTKNDNDPDHYKVISKIDDNETNILQLKIQKKDDINYKISYDWFIKNITDNNWILTLSYDKWNIDNNASVTITFKDKNWNILDVYKILLTKKQQTNNKITLNPWSIWYLDTDWKLYWTYQTNQKQNVFVIDNLSNKNLICKDLNTKITFTSSNILDNFYLYNSKIENNKNLINENNIKWWLKVINNDTLEYDNITHNINLKDYTDNFNRFYIESNKITADNHLQTKVNITCLDFSWNTHKLVDNKTYDLTINKNSDKKLSIVFYNPVMENWTIMPLVSYAWEGKNTLIYQNNKVSDRVLYKNVENRLQLTYYYKGISNNETNWNIPINWLDNSYWGNNWNSNHIFTDIYSKIRYEKHYWKEDNRFQYNKNNTTATKWIITTNNGWLQYQPVDFLYYQPLTPPVCSYTICWKNSCHTYYRYWEKRRNYYYNRNYDWNYYTNLLWWSLRTQNVDLSNTIRNDNIWKTYSYNNTVNFSFSLNVPTRIFKTYNANDLSKKNYIITPFFYIRNITDGSGLIINYADSNKIAKRIETNSYSGYLQKNSNWTYKYLKEGILTLNSKLKGYVKKAWLRKVLIWPCLTDFENWNYNNWNTKRCYTTFNKSVNSIELTNNVYKAYNTNTSYWKDIFPQSKWKTVENIVSTKWVFNLQYVYDIIIDMKPITKNKQWDYNISQIDNSANKLLDNWWENLLNIDLPIQYVWQSTVLWSLLHWKLNSKKINSLISFYNNISNKAFTTVNYWINLYKTYFTKMIEGYQNSTVITEKYYYWGYCDNVWYDNYIENKNFNLVKIDNVKMNFGAWYYKYWYSDWKYPTYFNDFYYPNDYDKNEKMIDKNVDNWTTIYNSQVGMVWNKIKLFWIWFTNNPQKFANSQNWNFWWKIMASKNTPNFITNTYNNWDNKYKTNSLTNFIDNWKYFNKIIYVNNNDDLNKLLFDWSDYNWDTLATWNWITKIIVNYNNVNIIWYNWNNQLKWNISLISNNNDINIITDINKNDSKWTKLYYWIFQSKNGNINVWNNVVYINWIYLIANNINTYYSSNPLIIHWFVYNLWNWQFTCNRNITNVFLVQNSNQEYSNYQNINFNNIWNINFQNFRQLYTSNKSSGCTIKNNYKMKQQFTFKNIWTIWY